MWLGFKFGVILVVLHSTYASQEYFDTNNFDLRHVIPGEPEVDYPIYSVAPRTSFSCIGRHEGYYADMETRCQVFRICTNTDFTGRGFPFLCPNGTLFNQKHFVCDWYRNVDCDGSGDFYFKNSENGLESKDQMMRKAQMMVEFPMRSLMRTEHEQHLTNARPTTRQPITNKPFVKSSPHTFEAITKPSVLRVANNPEHATFGNEVFVSSLGELSSDPRTTFNPDTSVIINNESPSQLLEAPRFVDLASFASNVNGLVDDVEAEGGLIPNVVSVRSPKVPAAGVKYMSKGFSMPQSDEPLKTHDPSPSPIITEQTLESDEARKNAGNLLLSGVKLTTFDDLTNSLESKTEAIKSVVSEAPLLINVPEEEVSSTTEASTSTTITTEAVTSSTDSATSTTTTTLKPTKLTKPPRVALSKLKVSPNRVSNYKYKYARKDSSSTTEEPVTIEENNEGSTTTTKKHNRVVFNRNFSRPTRPTYRRTTTTTTDASSISTTSKSSYPYQSRSVLTRKSPLKSMKYYSKYSLASTTTTTEPTSSTSSSTTESTTTTTTSTTTEPSTTSKYFSFEKLKQSIIDDTILQNYKKTQEEQAKLNPQPIQSAFSVAPLNSNYYHQAPTGRSYNNFYPQYLNLPRSSAVTTQTPDISFHTQLQNIHPDIVIARSEEHSPFPLETRTARGTPAPPSSGQYVPLKQYINQNFQKKTYPNYNYAQPQNAIQYKAQPQSQPKRNNGQYQKQQTLTGQYQKQQTQTGQYQPKSTQNGQYQKQQTQTGQYQKQQPQSAVQYQSNKISTVQEKIPLFPPLVQLKAQPQAQAKKQSFQTYQQFAFKTIPIAQRRFGLAEFEEAKKPNYSLFNGVSSYDVPLSSIGILRTIQQQRLQNNRVQG